MEIQFDIYFVKSIFCSYVHTHSGETFVHSNRILIKNFVAIVKCIVGCLFVGHPRDPHQPGQWFVG